MNYLKEPPQYYSVGPYWHFKCQEKTTTILLRVKLPLQTNTNRIAIIIMKLFQNNNSQ